MSDPTTTTNSATDPLDNPNPSSLFLTGDGTHLTSTVTTTSSAAELIPANTTPSDPTLNSSEDVDTPLVSRLREAPVDPRVVALRAMFPDYDDLILQSVLDSVGGNQDRAIDTLLGMSDPDYRSETRPAVEVPALTQTELDEEFARRLMLEDQERQQQAWAAQQAAQRPQRGPYPNQQQPPTPNTGPPVSSGDTMGDIQQQFSRIAESGKKTFGNIFSKVKAKIQEFDQPKPAQGSDISSQLAQWEASDGYTSQYYQPGPQGSHPYAVRQTYTAPQVHSALYDPSEYTPSPASGRAYSPPITMSPPPRTSAVQGYDVTPDPPSTNSRTPPPPGISVPTGNSNSPQRAPIDGGKLGLLPKRPVSLLTTQDSSTGTGSQNPRQIHRSASEDDSDSLEYTESPFEEHK